MVQILLAVAVLSFADGSDKPIDRTLAPLLAAHNREGSQETLEPLKLSDKLCKAAAVHARDMAAHPTLEHKGSDGSTMADRVKRQGYVFVKVGENIANGQKTVDEVMTTWMNSPATVPIFWPITPRWERPTSRMTTASSTGAWTLVCPYPGSTRRCRRGGCQADESRPRGCQTTEAESGSGTRPCRHEARRRHGGQGQPQTEGDPFKIIDDEGVRLRELRIMLGANAPTPEEATKSLVGEDAEELKAFEEIGIGYAIAENGTPYWCAIFAKPAPPKRIIRR